MKKIIIILLAVTTFSCASECFDMFKRIVEPLDNCYFRNNDYGESGQSRYIDCANGQIIVESKLRGIIALHKTDEGVYQIFMHIKSCKHNYQDEFHISVDGLQTLSYEKTDVKKSYIFLRDLLREESSDKYMLSEYEQNSNSYSNKSEHIYDEHCWGDPNGDYFCD